MFTRLFFILMAFIVPLTVITLGAEEGGVHHGVIIDIYVDPGAIDTLVFEREGMIPLRVDLPMRGGLE